MKLILKGHDARYAVEQSLLAFFPQERPVYDPAAQEENWAAITLAQAAKYTTAVTTIDYHGHRERGISRIVISMNNSTDWEVDHLQYGLTADAVPEPSTIVLCSLSLLALAARRFITK